MSKYLIRRPNGSTEGPYTAAELRTLAYEGQLTDADQISPLGETRWVSARKVGGIREILEALAPPPPPPGPAAGDGMRADDLGDAGANAGQSRVSAFVDDFDAPAAGPSGAAPSSVSPDAPTAPPFAPATASASAFGAAPQARRPAAAVAGEGTGISDRILRGAFRFARGISVLVILGCSLALLGSLALVGYNFVPSVPLGFSSGVEAPELAAFVEECRPIEIETEPQSGRNQSGEPRRQVQQRNDECAPYREDFEFAVRKLALSAEAEEILCQTVLRFSEEYREPFTTGLRVLATQYEKDKPEGNSCSPADAVNWYIREFQSRVAADRAAKAEAELAAIAESARRQQQVVLGLSIAGGAVLVLLAFLFLPLLIQIERNTRQLLAT